MRDETVARSYAETLFELALRHEGIEVYGEGIAEVAGLLDENPRFRLFLETPRIDASAKKAVLRKVFAKAFPQHLVNFLLITIDKRRQRLLRKISREYQALLDDHLGRAHVEVTVARETDEADLASITERLQGLLGKSVVPHVRVRPEILGGVVVRAGDTIYDGSVRRRLGDLRRQLMAVELPELDATGELGSLDAAEDSEGD